VAPIKGYKAARLFENIHNGPHSLASISTGKDFHAEISMFRPISHFGASLVLIVSVLSLSINFTKNHQVSFGSRLNQLNCPLKKKELVIHLHYSTPMPRCSRHSPPKCRERRTHSRLELWGVGEASIA
jgi:hypothetical protein